MLVLTRRAQETLMIGEDIEITVLGIVRGQVRIGINAPDSVKILRSELFGKVKKQREQDKKRQAA